MRIDRSRASVDRAVDDELRFHFDMTMRELMADGMTPDDARREAERRFGDVETHRERLAAIDRSQHERARRIDWWNGLRQDLRYALRGLRLKPGFAAAVVATLGLGIGANAAMFGIVDRLLFRPPAYLANADRVHRLYFGRMIDGKEFVNGTTQYQRYLDITAATRTLDATAAYSSRQMAVGSGDETRDVLIGAITSTMWQLFDAKPVVGRFFTASEDLPPNGTRVAVLSHSYWKSRYNASPSIVGQTMRIGPSIYTIVGVAPAGFAGMSTETPVAFIPMTAAADDSYASVWVQCRTKYCLTWIYMFGRRKPGVTAEQATADLGAAFRQSYLAHIAVSPRLTPIDIAKPRVVIASTLAERGPNRQADTRVASWLLGVAGIVLLIGCANVGNLLLGRALRRRREIAVRIALGISRARLLRQLLIESLLLAALGCLAGLAVAQWGGGVLRALLLPRVEWTGAIADPRVALFSAAIAIVAGVLCGLAPVFYASRTDVATALKSGSREGRSHRSRLRSSLLIAQAALSVVLLVGAGLFVRSVRNVGRVHLGFDAERLLWVEPRLRGTKLDSVARREFRMRLLDHARRAPDVENAASAVAVPFWMEWNSDLFVAGIDSVQKLGDFDQQAVSPTFFATMGTRIVRGRGITAEDRRGAPLAVVVSEGMAKVLWPTVDALGQCIRIAESTSPCSTVVGIAENIKQHSLGEDPSFTYYQSFDQVENPSTGMFIRTRGEATMSSQAVRRHLQAIMPGNGYIAVFPMASVLEPRQRSWQLGATMFAVFGGLALVLAGIGLYSVIAYSVTERTHELGVRIALGARVIDVASLVVRDSLTVVGAGVALGLIAAIAAGKWVAPLLFQISPRDPIVLASVVVVLVAAGLAASWLPARRASRVDPNVALRAD
jgi:putative ABC transport system permease protein